MTEMTYAQTMKDFPRLKARTLRFSCGAPHSMTVLGDGSRMLFLRSDGPEDLVTALWMQIMDPTGDAREVLVADPRTLLTDADNEDVPQEERARRERAREGGQGIVGYHADAAGEHVVFSINGALFLATLGDAGADAGAGDGAESVDTEGSVGPVGSGARAAAAVPTVRRVAADALNPRHPQWLPILNPRLSADGKRIAYSTGSSLVMVEIGANGGVCCGADDGRGEAGDGRGNVGDAGTGTGTVDGDAVGADVVHTIWSTDRQTQRVGLAEFVAGEEMDRYEGFWWSPDCDALLFEIFDSAREPLWYISDPANPERPAQQRRYPRALTNNADVRLFHAKLGFDASGSYRDAKVREVDWDRDAYEYLAAVSWVRGRRPVILVQNRRQNRDQVLQVMVKVPDGAASSVGGAGGFDDVDGCDGVGSDERDDAHVMTTVTTTVLETHRNDQWLDIVLGTPCFTPDGRLICACNDMSVDTNRLTVDGVPFTPVGWQVRQVLDVNDDNVLVVVQRTPEYAPQVPEAWQATADRHDARSQDVVTIDYDGTVTPINREPGMWTAHRCGAGLAVAGRTMHDARAVMVHMYDPAQIPEGRGGRSVSASSVALCESGVSTTSGAHVSDGLSTSERQPPADGASNGERGGFVADVVDVADVADIAQKAQYAAVVRNASADPGFTPNTTFCQLGEHRLFTAITRPSADGPYAGAKHLPVLLKPYGGPGFQQVSFSQAFYWESQWWADQGFLVVTSDGRGTTGRGPAWDRAIFEQMKDVTLADQVETVHALAAVAPEADLDKVAMIGWSYGGFLSALAVLDAPDVVQAACAGAPPTDWTLYDTHYTERYLGLDPDVYARNGIVNDAPQLRRPLMLIHGFSDDNVTIAHSLRLSQALMAAGREHTYLPLTGITHMTNDETVAENLLTLQRDFLYRALDIEPL